MADDTIFDELLRTMSEQLDIRAMFPRVSEIASRILPHDRLTMTFHDGHGNIAIEAASNDDFPGVSRLTVDESGLRALDQPFVIADDLSRTPLPIAEPRDLNDHIAALGYRSLLRVHLQARDEAIGLAFWSKRPHSFAADDAAVARRIADHVALAVSHEQLAESARRRAEAQVRAERPDARASGFGERRGPLSARIAGASEQWKRTLKRALQVGETETTVLLSGESGTGKEVVARLVHRSSPRRRGPFVAINCAALPEQLLESELFGYERGAFTGAMAAKPGHLELASGGVLFLDEVTEMSLQAQSKFLRVLQEREFQRLGGTRLLKANIRVIAATNRDLRKAVESGAFREDLYYRLQVFEIRLPPLRERPADVLPLSELFLEEIARSLGRPPSGLSRDARRALLMYWWPGNVRELQNALERAAILAGGGLIAAGHLSLPSVHTTHTADAARITHTTRLTRTTDLNMIEHQAITQVMQQVQGNKSEAARRLGLSRTQLYVRLRKYRLASLAGTGWVATERPYNVG
jgi:transcriptional regulator with GAF, ATPase, and Fis domain